MLGKKANERAQGMSKVSYEEVKKPPEKREKNDLGPRQKGGRDEKKGKDEDECLRWGNFGGKQAFKRNHIITK